MVAPPLEFVRVADRQPTHCQGDGENVCSAAAELCAACVGGKQGPVGCGPVGKRRVRGRIAVSGEEPGARLRWDQDRGESEVAGGDRGGRVTGIASPTKVTPFTVVSITAGR